MKQLLWILCACLWPLGTPQAQEAGFAWRADQFTVAASTAQNGDVTLTLTALPVINACGKFDPIPVTAHFDRDAVDVQIGGFAFRRARGSGVAACGPVNKVAMGRVTLPARDLNANATKMIRFWDGPLPDTYYLTRTGSKVFLNSVSPATRVFLK